MAAFPNRLLPRPGVPGLPRIEIGEDELRIGRETDCDIRIPELTVSRRHARLFREGSDLWVEDLGSTGGTYVNEARVDRAVLRHGDALRLGPRCEWELVGASEASVLVSSSFAAEKNEPHDEMRQLQALLEVARSLDGATVLDDVLVVVLDAALRLVDADSAEIVMLEEGGVRVPVAARPAGTPPSDAAAEGSIVSEALRTGRTVVRGGGSSPTHSMAARGIAEALATPLRVARRPMGTDSEASFIGNVQIVGALLIERRGSRGGFQPRMLAVLESLASEAAMAIDGARLYRESRDMAKMEHEMALARTIQAALLKPPPEIPFARIACHFHPARAVGGDLYFTSLRADGRLAIALGDVSGKGFGAALWMALVQGLLGLLADLGKPLEESLTLLDRSLRQHNPGNRFLTLASALVGPDGEVELANAGHCPILIRRTGGALERFAPTGPVLGLVPAPRFTTTGLRMERGDLLLFYSDGISESADSAGREFETDGVAKALASAVTDSPAAAIERVLRAAEEHRAGEDPTDDVSLVALLFTG